MLNLFLTSSVFVNPVRIKYDWVLWYVCMDLECEKFSGSSAQPVKVIVSKNRTPVESVVISTQLNDLFQKDFHQI
jgi:hypothetical protein